MLLLLTHKYTYIAIQKSPDKFQTYLNSISNLKISAYGINSGIALLYDILALSFDTICRWEIFDKAKTKKKTWIAQHPCEYKDKFHAFQFVKKALHMGHPTLQKIKQHQSDLRCDFFRF